MTRNTSATLSKIEIEKLHKIKDDLELNLSSAIRMALKMTEDIDLEKYIDRSDYSKCSKEISKDIVHYSTSEETFLNIEFLSDFYGVNKSIIIGSSILAFSDQDFFKK